MHSRHTFFSSGVEQYPHIFQENVYDRVLEQYWRRKFFMVNRIKKYPIDICEGWIYGKEKDAKGKLSDILEKISIFDLII